MEKKKNSALSAEQERVLAHLNSVLVVPEGMELQEGQFDDAEPEEEGGDEGVQEEAANGGLGHAPSS
ncbi:unnamed protein product [Discosporangium mesarthrocarpum]